MGCATETKENVHEFHVLDSLSNESTGATSSDRCTPCKQRLTSTAAHAQRTGRSKQTTKRSIRSHNHTFPGYFRTTYSWMRASVCHIWRFHASRWRDTSRRGPLPTPAFCVDRGWRPRTHREASLPRRAKTTTLQQLELLQNGANMTEMQVGMMIVQMLTLQKKKIDE